MTPGPSGGVLDWAGVTASPPASHRLGTGVQTRSQAHEPDRQQTPAQEAQQQQQGDPATPQGQLLPPPTASTQPPGAPRKKPPSGRRQLALSPGAPVRKLDFADVAVQLGQPMVAAAEGMAAPRGGAAAQPAVGGHSKPSKLQRIR